MEVQPRLHWTLPLTRVVFVQAMLGHRIAWFEMGTQNRSDFAVTLTGAMCADANLTPTPDTPRRRTAAATSLPNSAGTPVRPWKLLEYNGRTSKRQSGRQDSARDALD